MIRRMKKAEDHRRKVTKSGRSLMATIPKDVADYLGVEHLDTLSWQARIIKGERVAVVKLPGD